MDVFYMQNKSPKTNVPKKWNGHFRLMCVKTRGKYTQTNIFHSQQNEMLQTYVKQKQDGTKALKPHVKHEQHDTKDLKPYWNTS